MHHVLAMDANQPSPGWYLIKGLDTENPSTPKPALVRGTESTKYSEFSPDTVKTHVNASLVLASGGRIGRSKSSKKGNKKDLHINVGNDARQPWLRQMDNRNMEFHTVETLTTTNLITSGVAPVYAGIAFTISAVQDFASFSDVFDQYRINLIEILIQPQVTEVTSVAGDVGSYISVTDVDDANAPTSAANLGSYPGVVETNGTVSHYHRFVPSVAVAVYSGTFTSFAATTSMWLDCGSSGIQHYGLKVATLPSTAVQTYAYGVRLHCMWRARH